MRSGQADIVEYFEGDYESDKYDKFACCGGPHPIQGICNSVTHIMGPKVITDYDVYKYLESWTSLNMNPAVKEACDATGTSPFSHEMHGATISTGEVVSHSHE